MLNNVQFYHKLLRKYVSTFGNMFNNITLVRTDDNNTELNRIRVPIVYGPKEKYITRLMQNPDLNKEVQITLPRMSFFMDSIVYDKSRKQNSLYFTKPVARADGAKTQYMGVPYDLGFSLSLYARNIDDANQIVEQILPYFNQDYTPTIFIIDGLNLSRDIPIILESVASDIEYEGNGDSVRYVMWELKFTVKAWFFGPISNTGIIREVIANIYENSGATSGSIIRVNTNNGNNGDFQLGDIVYQGDNLNIATAFGKVNEWTRASNILQIGGYQGTFVANSVIRAQSTNAAYNLASFDVTPLKLTKIDITPNPINAMANSDYGYTTVITEFPNITG